MLSRIASCAFGACVIAAAIAASGAAGSAVAAARSCAAGLNAPQPPFRIYGNTYYVGTHGVASILIVADRGNVLIDGDLAESAPQIAGNIRALGFRPEDVKLILNSHVHCDHAGGIAQLQRLTGAAVRASPWSARILTAGGLGRDDPQYGIAAPIAPVAKVGAVADGETLSVGRLGVTAHFTPGHTPGGTSWTWEACEKARCLHIVYADSLSAVSAPGFRFAHSAAYPNALADFQKSFAVLRRLPCDMLVTDHPDFSDLWRRLAARNHGAADALVDPAACRRYVDGARASLEKRIAREKSR